MITDENIGRSFFLLAAILPIDLWMALKRNNNHSSGISGLKSVANLVLH